MPLSKVWSNMVRITSIYFSGFIFKTVSEPHVGELSLLKVVSGHIKPGEEVLNTSRNESERMGQIYVLNGKHRTETAPLIAGDIGAVVKLKATHTGDTLSDPKAPIVPSSRYPRAMKSGWEPV